MSTSDFFALSFRRFHCGPPHPEISEIWSPPVPRILPCFERARHTETELKKIEKTSQSLAVIYVLRALLSSYICPTVITEYTFISLVLCHSKHSASDIMDVVPVACSWDQSPSLPIPLDILFDIVIYLPLQSVLTLRRTSKTLYAVTQLRSLWTLVFRTHVLEKNLPHPDLGSTSLESLSALDLENLVRRTVTLRRNWTRPEPIHNRRIIFNTSTESNARIVFLQFLPGRSNRWLVSGSMTPRPRRYMLQCWDVAAEEPRCVAQLTHAEGPYGGVVINSDPTSMSVLAMQSAQTETFSINFDAEDPECGFVTEATIDGIRELHLLSGSTLVIRQTNNGGEICLWDLNDLREEKLKLVNPSPTQNDRPQSIHLASDYAVIARVQTIEIYSTVARHCPCCPHTYGAPVAHPLVQFKFQWRMDTVTMCEQIDWRVSASLSLSDSHRRDPHTRTRPWPLNLFVRFGSIYPWPVNVLHHYILLPNPSYLPTGTTAQNVPYDVRPHAVQTIGSPVRLFSTASVALGRYGTALWLDNHTEEWLGPSELGQRLAGRMLVPPAPDMNGIVSMDLSTAVSSIIPESGGSDGGAGASMVFGLRDDDTWTRIAMEEEAGRIALGHVDGAVTLLEY